VIDNKNKIIFYFYIFISMMMRKCAPLDKDWESDTFTIKSEFQSTSITWGFCTTGEEVRRLEKK
jgi:hypothetical protein